MDKNRNEFYDDQKKGMFPLHYLSLLKLFDFFVFMQGTKNMETDGI